MAQLQYPLLLAVQSLVQGLGFTWNSQPVAVSVLKEPVLRDVLQTAPVFAVCPCAGDGATRWWMGAWRVTYGIQVALIAAGNLDLASSLSTWMGWRKAVMDALREPTAIPGVNPAITSISQVEIQPDDPLDRGMIPDGLDFSSVRFKFSSLESSP